MVIKPFTVALREVCVSYSIKVIGLVFLISNATLSIGRLKVNRFFLH